MAAPERRPTILAVLVLYRMSASESTAFGSLDGLRSGDAGIRGQVDVLLWDNSPEPHAPPPGFAGRFRADSSNPGLAAAYNAGLEIAAEEGIPWLLLLDQDTALTREFLTEVLEETEAGVAALLPRLMHHGRVVSPSLPQRMGPPLPYPETGVAVSLAGASEEARGLQAFNSGAVLRVSMMKTMGGFDTRFPLDYLDHATFAALQRAGAGIKVLRSRLEHSLSTDTGKALTAGERRRQRQILRAEHRFYAVHGDRTDRLLHPLRLLRRAASVVAHKRDVASAGQMLREMVARADGIAETEQRSATPAKDRREADGPGPGCGKESGAEAVGVEVLLATWNGSQYLRRQVESVLQQTEPALTILARDDGSADETQRMLAEMAAEAEGRIRILQTVEPTGSAAGNFLLLLRSSTAPYVAFCDQDDVWLTEKIARSMERMRAMEAKHGPETPLLVFSDLAVVNERLEPIAPSLWRNNGIAPETVHRMERLLSENVVTGCTMLINRAMARVAEPMPAAGVWNPALPEALQGAALMHDHWIALLACSLGAAAWIDAPTVLYRQHGGNAVGADRGDASLNGKLRRLFGTEARQNRQRSREALGRQAEAFLRTYRNDLPHGTRDLLEAYADLGRGGRWHRILSTVRHGFWRGTRDRNVTTIFDLLR